MPNGPVAHEAAQQVDTTGLDAEKAQRAREDFARALATQQAEATQRMAAMQQQIDELKAAAPRPPKNHKRAPEG